MKFFVSGLINIETTVSVREFPINYYPIDYPFFGVNSAVSGVGYNISKALTALGDSVNFSSLTGDDAEAERIEKALSESGISREGIKKTLKNTPVSVVLYDNSGKRQIYCDLKDIQEKSLSFIEIADKLKEADTAVICNINFNRGLIKEAKKLGKTTACDVHVLSDIDDEYNKDFMENSDILFLSDEALPCPAEEFLKRIEDKYRNKIIVLGRGSKGAMILERDAGKIYSLEAFKAEKVVNTVGAGDALFSAFLHFYTENGNALTALKKAEIFAAIKIGSNGASLGFTDAETVNRLYREADIKVDEMK